MPILVCALAPAGASAQVVITEVMYDLAEGSDSGREWIEVFNAGTAPVELVSWRLYENGTNHKITTRSGSATVAPGSYAIIADNADKFEADWPSFGGQLFDSAFSLSNEGETLVLRNSAQMDADSIVFTSGMGGNGTGDSLQRVSSGALEAGAPTPGAGIPAGGLEKSPPKEGSAPAKKEVPSSRPTEIIGDVAPEPQVAGAASVAAATPQTPSFVWWFAPLVLALGASGAVVWSRHLKKDEWTILEETG